MRCAQCESDSFEEVRGHLVCTVCGLQNKDVLVTEVEDLQEAEFGENGASAGFVRTISISKGRNRSWIQFEEAIQTVLRAQCEILVTDFAFPPQFTQVVGRVWFHYLASPSRRYRGFEFGSLTEQRERAATLEMMRRQYLKENKLRLVRPATEFNKTRYQATLERNVAKLERKHEARKIAEEKARQTALRRAARLAKREEKAARLEAKLKAKSKSVTPLTSRRLPSTSINSRPSTAHKVVKKEEDTDEEELKSDRDSNPSDSDLQSRPSPRSSHSSDSESSNFKKNTDIKMDVDEKMPIKSVSFKADFSSSDSDSVASDSDSDSEDSDKIRKNKFKPVKKPIEGLGANIKKRKPNNLFVSLLPAKRIVPPENASTAKPSSTSAGLESSKLSSRNTPSASDDSDEDVRSNPSSRPHRKGQASSNASNSSNRSIAVEERVKAVRKERPTVVPTASGATAKATKREVLVDPKEDSSFWKRGRRFAPARAKRQDVTEEVVIQPSSSSSSSSGSSSGSESSSSASSGPRSSKKTGNKQSTSSNASDSDSSSSSSSSGSSSSSKPSALLPPKQLFASGGISSSSSSSDSTSSRPDSGSSSDSSSSSSSESAVDGQDRSEWKTVTLDELPDFEPPKTRNMTLTELTRTSDTLHLTLQLLLMGIWYLRIPVLPADLLDWAMTGRIPYLTAYKLLPTSMSYYRAMKPVGVPSVPIFLRDTVDFVTELKFDAPLPPINAIPIMARLATLLQIPPEIEHAAMRLYYINPRFNGTFEAKNSPYENVMAHLIIALKILYRFDNTYALSPIAMRFDGIKAKSLPEWLLERYKIERNRPVPLPWTRADLDHLPRDSLYDLIDFLKYINSEKAEDTDILTLQNMFDARPPNAASFQGEVDPSMFNQVGELSSFAKHSLSDTVPLDSASRPFCPVLYKPPSDKNTEATANDALFEANDDEEGEETKVEFSLQRDLHTGENGKSAVHSLMGGSNTKKEPTMDGINKYRIPYRVYERAIEKEADLTYEYVLQVCANVLKAPVERIREAVLHTEHYLFPEFSHYSSSTVINYRS